jgi:hypothetical protein
LFNFKIFLVGFQFWSDHPQSFNASTSMGILNYVLGIEVMRMCPLAPHSLHRAGRIYQDSIQVKENGFAGKDHFSE